MYYIYIYVYIYVLYIYITWESQCLKPTMTSQPSKIGDLTGRRSPSFGDCLEPPSTAT